MTLYGRFWVIPEELDACLADGFDSMIVFTQYTDTMEYLRDYLADQMSGMPVACYSGAGGAWRDASGQWVPCSKEEIKRRLRDRQVRLLVCTDAAGEGLNLQFAGVLVNYDLPWNPMKVEQRIGRIDRLGQQRAVIRVLSFAYKDTVEQDVFFTVGTRINLFQGIVGRLQPILSRLPRRFEELALLDRDARDAARQRFLADLEQQVRDADESGFDIFRFTPFKILELQFLLSALLSVRITDGGEQHCPGSISSNASRSAHVGNSFPFLATTRATPTGQPCPKVDTSSSGTWVASGGVSSAEPPWPKPWNHRSENGMNSRGGILAFPDLKRPANRPRTLLCTSPLPIIWIRSRP